MPEASPSNEINHRLIQYLLVPQKRVCFRSTLNAGLPT